MHPLKSAAPLIVYIDIKSPYAFIAINPTLKLERELGLQFDWRPLTLDIASYLGSAEKKQGAVVSSTGRSKRTWAAIRYAYHDARRYAERQGLVLKGTEKIWDSSKANTAILWVCKNGRGKLPDFLRLVYGKFWRRELDIENLDVIKDCLRKCNVTVEGFDDFINGDGRALHDTLQAQLHPHSLYGVPSYVAEQEVFFGREHIPYLRWLLGGKKGAAPDIAYEIAPC